ncbi:nucleoside deaminase [Niabella digestorum]|uniref:tRNA-specific adenosine deaminase n=1 Tax=Niabella digestorum TaxID=3117701 RepID=A0ABU7RHL2_9BACT
MYTDEYFMRLALKEAKQALEEEEIPIGAIVVQDNKILARGHNMTEKLNDATAHAEIIALTAAFSNMGSKYLPDATLYVTVEPCVMCAGALYWSKIKRVVWGASDPKNGFSRVKPGVSPFHPKTEVVSGILETECVQLIKEFFRNKR